MTSIQELERKSVTEREEQRAEEKNQMQRLTERGTKGHGDVIDTVSNISLDNIT